MSAAKQQPLLERRPIAIILLALILLVGAYLRFTGINWDADQHLHPDERFLTSVEASLQSVSSWAEYFDTENSTLNPNNRGHHFFVYGTFPVFIVRYAAEWIGQTGLDQIQLVGRPLSGLADLSIVFLLYLIGTALFNRRVGLLAAAFSAITVAQIQQSHFLTVDNFTNFFTYLAVLFAVRVAVRSNSKEDEQRNLPGSWEINPFDYAFFGISLGLAVASKVSSAPLALLLPLAAAIALAKKKQDERMAMLRPMAIYVGLAAFLSLLVFRIAQPYTFAGPGFFNVGLNPKWLDTMRQLAGQVSGDVDWPPSMQWARRNLLFGAKNMTLWGMGFPLAILAWTGLAWAGRRLYLQNWLRAELVVWAWGLGYFIWQSFAFNPTMRYFLPAYPALALFAAFALYRLWEWAGERNKKSDPAWKKWARPISIGLTTVVLLLTSLWAFAFVQIYRNPVTRIEASQWIYQNVPGPLTLHIQNEDGEFHQPISLPYNYALSAESPYFSNVHFRESGTLDEIDAFRVIAPLELDLFRITEAGQEIIFSANRSLNWHDLSDGSIRLDQEISPDDFGEFQVDLRLPQGTGTVVFSEAFLVHSNNPEILPIPVFFESAPREMGGEFSFSFFVEESAFPDQLQIHLRSSTSIVLDPFEAEILISTSPEMNGLLATADLDLHPTSDPSAPIQTQTFMLDQSVQVDQDQNLYLELRVDSESPAIFLGAALANESSWDDGLPRRMDGYDGFGGIYQGLNFELYWEENLVKLDRFVEVMDGADYLFISSSRQWASLPRIPERYPLSAHYYRELMGCQAELAIEECYNRAQIEDFSGNLGFELIRVYQSNPHIGNFAINDQPSEEAFTVYDHPKVFLFQKTEAYNSNVVRAILEQVDLDAVRHVTPKQAAGSIAANLILPEDRWEQQTSGGTWSDIFDTDAFVNASPWDSAVIWYLALSVMAWASYPLLRAALPGLADRAFPFARLAFLLLFAYFSWLGASLGLTFTRGWLLAIALLLIGTGMALAYRQREELLEWWRANRSYILRVELLFLGFFVFMLLIRLGNSDLWHPGKGGEKPMDFAYFNAVLKSSTFPAFDPWFAEGYINYYYYGFVLVGSLTKLLGIIPSVAYNLILPTLFAMLAMGAFSVAWNLIEFSRGRRKKFVSAWKGGLAAAASMVLIGNLGSLQMIMHGFQRIGSNGAFDVEAGLISKFIWTIRGFFANMLGEGLPFGLGDWYWNPTRIIPAPNETMPITEFPLFTFTYADLHAHMIALPITLLILAWLLSIVFNKAWKGKASLLQIGWSFLFAAIVIGSLRATNTWDFPTYLALPAIAAFYAFWRYWPKKKGEQWRGPVFGALAAGVLSWLSFLTFQPYANWYRQGFTSFEIWDGSHTPFSTYLVHWGIFLFFIVIWMLWETRQWLAQTPLSSVRKLEPYLLPIAGGIIATLVAIMALWRFDIAIGWFVLPMMIWAGLLIIRPKQEEAKRLVLFLIGTGLFITLLVEVGRLEGDISRMNTVFKFYMQVWVLFGLGATMAIVWTLNEFNQWDRVMRRIWQSIGIALIGAGALFMLLGVRAKIADRMAADAPRTLDGLTYMQYALYYDRDQELQLEQDYQAIRWLQENVVGSPVIVEAHAGEYRWGSRISINTGLPAVIGWNWHQRQQREFVPGNDIWGRVGDVQQFYEGENIDEALNFLSNYGVQYIIMGQLEQAYYPESLSKFEAQDGVYWQEVFNYKDTKIYQVNLDLLSALLAAQ